MCIKLPMYLFTYMALWLNDFDGANPLHGLLEGVCPENLDFFGTCFAHCHFRAHPFQWICPNQNYYVPRHITIGTLTVTSWLYLWEGVRHSWGHFIQLHLHHYTELEFLKSLWGLGTEEEEVYRTGPPGYIGWRNSFLGIDFWAP